jgi:hypothetical protein
MIPHRRADWKHQSRRRPLLSTKASSWPSRLAEPFERCGAGRDPSGTFDDEPQLACGIAFDGDAVSRRFRELRDCL